MRNRPARGLIVVFVLWAFCAYPSSAIAVRIDAINFDNETIAGLSSRLVLVQINDGAYAAEGRQVLFPSLPYLANEPKGFNLNSELLTLATSGNSLMMER